MSMIGIGLGGFMQGFQKGQDLKLQNQRSKYLDEQMAREKTMQERQDAEWKRQDDQRASIAKIGTEAQQNFDAQVKAGTQKPADFDAFWSQYAVPKLTQTYLASGDIDNANRVKAWGESADAKAGGKLAMGALLKAQTGDYEGAFGDAIKAGQLKGYIDHGLEMKEHTPVLSEADKSLIGYNVLLTGPDGKELKQFVRLDVMPKLIATYLNPEAAWQSQVDARNAAAKKQDDLATYEDKKKIDRQYGVGGSSYEKQRGDAITSLRKRLDGGIAGRDPKFDDLPRDQQEAKIAQEMELQAGAASAPGLGTERATSERAPPVGTQRKVIVDTATGQPVPSAPEGKSAPAPAPAPQRPKKLSRDENVSYLLEYADKAVKDGENPLRVKDELLNNGIPAEKWPESVRAAVAKASRNQIGIGN